MIFRNEVSPKKADLNFIYFFNDNGFKLLNRFKLQSSLKCPVLILMQ